MNYIVYQAHTRDDIYYQTIYSIYSLAVQQASQPVTILLYTDNIPFFEERLAHLPVCYEQVTPNILTEWVGKHNFVFRAKIRMLQDALRKYTGNFLYLDSDTYFKTPIAPVFDRIEAGELFMHCFEKNLDRSKLYGPLLNYTTEIDGKPVTFTREVEIWNAGAIGLTQGGKTLLDRALTLTDQLLEYYRRFVVEQFSVSYIFQTTSKIQSLEPYIFHYWDLKEFRSYLRQIFQHPAGADRQILESIVRELDPEALFHEKMNWKYNGGIVRAFERAFGKKFALAPLEVEALIG
jgi:hypothetical protein